MTLSTSSAHRKDMTAGKARMEHRHFATIAAIIRDIPRTPELSPGVNMQRAVAEHFARELADTNPNFNRARFLAACDAE